MADAKNKLMRKCLDKLVESIDLKEQDTHAGLLLQRGLSEWKDDKKDQAGASEKEKNNNKKNAKQELLQKVADVSFSKLYEMAFKRWARVTADKERFAHVCATIDSRLYIGLNSAGALETGISTQHSYGMPMLPGSSIKGAVRHYAEQIGLPDNIRHVLFGEEGKAGEDGKAGALVWHDGWFIPDNTKPFVLEVVTVHHQQYYSGSQSEADEMESPIPNQQIAAQGSFYFVVEAPQGAKDWAKFAVNLLSDMLQQQGMGAKTASGYGYLVPNSSLEKHLVAEDDLEGKIRTMLPVNLVENLSRNKKCFFEQYQLNADNDSDMQKLAKLVWKHHQQTVEEWEKSDKKNDKKAYSFVSKYRSLA